MSGCLRQNTHEESMKSLIIRKYIITLIGSCLLLASCSKSGDSFQAQPTKESQDKIFAQSIKEFIETPLCEITEVVHKRGTCKVIVKHIFSQTEPSSYNVTVSSLSDCISTKDFLWRREQTFFTKKQLNNALFNQNASYEINFTNNMNAAVIKTSSLEYEVKIKVKNTINGFNTLRYIKSEIGANTPTTSVLNKQLCTEEVNPEIRSFCSETRMKDMGESVADTVPGTVGEQSRDPLRNRLRYALFLDDICYFTDRDYLFDVFLESGKY
jgi:hypothetical protein